MRSKLWSGMQRAMRRAGMMTLALAATGATASCVIDDDPVELGTAEDELYFTAGNRWHHATIKVCWRFPGKETEKWWVQSALQGQGSWAAASSVSFVGWGPCPDEPFDGIHIFEGAASTSPPIYDPFTYNDLVVFMSLDFGPSPSYARCTTNMLNREQCIKAVALHEFGHALAIAHEHNRPDTPSTCTSAPQGNNGDATWGVWDALSIMNYCNAPPQLSPLDRVGIAGMYGARNGEDLRLGDSNADKRADLLCHDTMTGGKWVDLTSSAATFDGTDHSSASGFCGHSSGRLYKGDFSRDGRDDLLCHDILSGQTWIDYASDAGNYEGTDWSTANVWCNGDRQKLFLGDFNRDDRDDLLCHDQTTGERWIDFADDRGHFNGTDWQLAGGFCSHHEARLLIGDFNGDRRDDLLCHDVVTGRKWIDYANEAGLFGAVDWERDARWCSHASGQLLVGDFDGNGFDDLLCHDVSSGYKWIDYADLVGQFWGTDWERNAGWCSHAGGRLLVGNVNGDMDRRDDLVCHDARTGAKWIDLAEDGGRFTGTDWWSTASWCGHDSGELR